MNKKNNLWMLGIAAMLASCSQNELTDIRTERETIAVFTVSMDGRVNTRSADATDNIPTRCLLEVYNAAGVLQGDKQYVQTSSDGTFTFTTDRLDKTQEYTFVFWADEGENAYTTTNLTTVTPGTTPGIAFSGKVELTPDGTNTAVTLPHAVAKLVLNQSMPLTVGDKTGVSLSVPKHTYNALTEKYEAVDAETIALGNDAIEITDGKQLGTLFSAYALVPGDENAEQVTVTLSYTKKDSKLGTKILEVPSVPLKRNFRTVITGDLAQLYTGVNQVFKAVIDEQWADDQPQNIKPNVVKSGSINVNVAGTLTTEEVTEALEGTSGALAITGTIGEKDFHLLATYAGDVPLTTLDLSGTTGLTSISNPKDELDPASTFTTLQTIKLPESCKTIRSSTFYKSAIVTLDGGGVETMRGYAANMCTELATINLPCAKEILAHFVNYSLSTSEDSRTCTLKLTAAGNITLDSFWDYQISSNSTLYLNPDKNPGSDSEATPKVEADSNTWGGKTFKEIIYEEPSSLTTE